MKTRPIFKTDCQSLVGGRVRTAEEGRLQQRRGESPLMEKLHQPHIFQLVTQRDWRNRQVMRERQREGETAAASWFLPDWMTLPCFCLLFLAARPIVTSTGPGTSHNHQVSPG